MKVQLIADSCFLFEFNGVRVLTDPWIGGAIYGGSWLQYPPPTIQAKDIGALDYIFISHIHEDHCDLKTLEKLDRNATVVLMDKKPNFVEKFLKYHSLKFKDIINLRPRVKFEAAPCLYFEVVEADPEHELNHILDSSLLIHFDSKTIYFANDNPPYPGLDQYLSQYNFELALLPPAGGSGYPACYQNLTDSEKLERAAQIIEKYQKQMLACLRRLKPRLFACAASSHVLAGRSAKLNGLMAWPKSAASPYKYLAGEVSKNDQFKPVLLNPGDQLELESEAGADYTSAIAFYENEYKRTQFINDVASNVLHGHEFIQLVPTVSFEYLMNLAFARLKGYLDAKNINLSWSYSIQIALGQYANISLSKPYTLEFSTKPCENNRLVIACDKNLLYLLLTGGFSWNIADASGFLSYHRFPDKYIFEVYIALNHLRI
ncbi:MBL fold metallo-hydrolase [Chitinibacter sp. FCG-7]|uniref:MBL fold metallo-hydrolase n=1 Tax=Chitinibacter mangrovi TaxID=3153927 RepID=A0AAU7F8M7_9NEIS